MNVKGIAFTGALLALIIGIVAVVMIIPGTTMVYDRLLCYTGAKWLLTPFGTSAGTASNSKIIIDSVVPTTSTYKICNDGCTDNYDEYNTKCTRDFNDCTNNAGSDCATDKTTCLYDRETVHTYCTTECNTLYDRNQEYVYFVITIGYYGSSNSTVNVSLSADAQQIWTATTDDMNAEDFVTLSTEPFKKSIYPCTFYVNAVANITGVTPAKYQLSGVPCVE
jgi:hypothetical protein